jgi:hypothetical protein
MQMQMQTSNNVCFPLFNKLDKVQSPSYHNHIPHLAILWAWWQIANQSASAFNGGKA